MTRLALRRLFVVGAALALSAQPSWSNENAGTQSPLLGATGLRALGMGGASAAVSGFDGMFRNPAGLASVERTMFATERADVGAIGVQYFSIAGALPSWRWGVLGVGLDQVGVDGIEERDDRNVLGNPNLSSLDQEFALAYAVPTPLGCNVGGAMRFERQSVAGFSGNAISSDLGVMLDVGRALHRESSWLSEASLGLSTRNLVQPSIRLDRESVADPRAITSGLAWGHPVGGLGRLLVALDLESVQGVGASVRAGTELRLPLGLSMRSGFADGGLTAGAGFSWQRVNVNYAFRDSRLEPMHYVGLEMSFGRTVEQARVSARLAEDGALQERVAKAFEAQVQARRADVRSRATQLREAGDLDGAVRLLSADDELLAAAPELGLLLRSSLREMGARLEAAGQSGDAALVYQRLLLLSPDDSVAARNARRLRLESDRRSQRQHDESQRLAEAREKFGRGDLGGARALLRKLAAGAPGDSEIAGMLRLTDRTIQNQADALGENIAVLLEVGRLDQADSLLACMRALAPESESARALALRLAYARRAANEPPAAILEPAPKPKTPLPPDSPEGREVAALFRRGVEALARSRTSDAIQLWERAWSKDPANAQVVASLKQQVLLAGMNAFSAGRLEEAERYWLIAVRVDPGDARGMAYVSRVREQIQRAKVINEASAQ